MSVRGFVTIIMTAQVLLCPFLPCGECCGMCPAAESAPVNYDSALPACCDQCRIHEEHQTPDDQPCPAGNRLLNCFCGGAILAAGTECSESEEPLTDMWFLTVDSDTLTRLAMLSRSGTQSANTSHIPPGAFGRDLCALIGAYLL